MYGRTRVMSVAFAPGAVFGNYRVEAVIGRGGMGVVYRATDLSLERPVALKLVAPELAEDSRFRERFLKEPRLAASLDHPNVVPIYEAGERDGHLYLVMRYVRGDDLRAVLDREGTLAPERCLTILAQVAGALDAAHRRGLVHRDVKPANVLLDEDGHPYLTDFGITKQLGGASTDTGRMVGTLDYLAPEQIRGEPVDGRTDVYSLACVLYECLSGAPPFHRATEAETLWAHMQEDPLPIRAHPALGPVFERALAKEKDDRYATCTDLIDAAAAALGVAGPRAPLFAPPGLVRRRRAILVAGVVVLAVAVTAGFLALTGGDDGQSAPGRSGLAAIDPGDGSLAAFLERPAAPSQVAIDGGAVWMLDTEKHAVSRVNPDTGDIVRTLRLGGEPAELAAGEGALWVGNAGGSGFRTVVSVSRVDPESGKVTRTVKLPNTAGLGAGGFPTAGLPRIAVGAGAVWAVNPDFSVSRIDPETGRLTAKVETDGAAWTIAAGAEGVWFLDVDRPTIVSRIDTRRNRVARRISIGASELLGVAVGGGSVWATTQQEGLLWRIEPGPRTVTRTIDVGVGVSFVDFGDGAVWTGNYIDGMVTRVDPATNTVAKQSSVGIPQALSVGAGAAWVSVAGGSTEGALDIAACGSVQSGGETPDVLIASDLPVRGMSSASPRAMTDAIRFVLERHGFRAGEFSVGYQSCDDSTAETGTFELRKCAANASAYAQAKQVVAVIGTYNSPCAQVEVPTLNRAPGGPVAMISPSNTHPGLTVGGSVSLPAPLGYKGEPDVFYPTRTRNYTRVVAREDLQGVAHGMLAEQLGLKGVYVLDDGSSEARILMADPFRRTARRLGVPIAGNERYNPDAKRFEPLVGRVARSGADGVLLGGSVYAGGDRLVQALRARLGPKFPIMVNDFLFAPVPTVFDLVGPAAKGLYLSSTDGALSERHLPLAGRRFRRDSGASGQFGTPLQYVTQAAQATEVLLAAIARSDGTRESVLKEAFKTNVRNGILGSFRLDANGDMTPAPITILRLTGRTPEAEPLPEIFEGATVDRVIRVPETLARVEPGVSSEARRP